MTPWEILGHLMGTILRFVPKVWWCPKWMVGVLFVRGKNVRPFGPGLVFWWPLWTSMLTCPATRQVMGIEAQTVTTRDGKSVIVAGTVTYKIVDWTTYLVDNFEADASVEEAVAAALRQAIVDRDWIEVKRNTRNKVDHALTKAAQEILEDFGVNVERVRLTSLAEARVVNVVGGGSGWMPDNEE